MTRSKTKGAKTQPSTDEDAGNKEETLKSSSAPLTSCAIVCIALAIGGVVMQWWWPLPILLFIGLMSQGYEDTVAAKANTGYPGLEVGDAIGMLFGGILLFIVCCVLFWGSFYLPTDGWDKIFSGPDVESVQGVIEADGDA